MIQKNRDKKLQDQRPVNESMQGMKEPKRNALGRGLDALIPEIDDLETSRETFFPCKTDAIRPNRYQPRRRFSEQELQALSKSISEQGIIQPLIVRKEADGYELVAGERRLRAAKMAGLTHVPVVVVTIPDNKLLEMTIIENVQREDLNPMEEAEAYYRLSTEFHLTQDQVARRLGKKRSTVTNFLRLRNLPEQIQKSIEDEVLSMGHARALLGTDDPGRQIAAWKMVMSKGLSVRATEALVRETKIRTGVLAREQPKHSEEIYMQSLAEDLARSLGTKVQIKRRGKQGTLEIEFYGDEDLDRLINILRRV